MNSVLILAIGLNKSRGILGHGSLFKGDLEEPLDHLEFPVNRRLGNFIPHSFISPALDHVRGHLIEEMDLVPKVRVDIF